MYKRQALTLPLTPPLLLPNPNPIKVRELAAAGITIISGGGNSGPSHGTLMNPADDPAVVGVGGLDENGALAAWSSRGMTTWELPHGYGRAGIDVVTYGEFWGKAPRGLGSGLGLGVSLGLGVGVGVGLGVRFHPRTMTNPGAARWLPASVGHLRRVPRRGGRPNPNPRP